MTNEEFQVLVLEKLSLLDTDVKKLETTQTQFGSQLQDVKENQNRFASDLQDVKENQNRFASDLQDVKERLIRIEHDHGKTLTALLDGWKLHDEKIDRILLRLDSVEEKLERHDIQISVLDRRATR
ncbi:hypothetical protein CEB3_c18010 [Peptococcaceae bacterium CEB3]|nr:hypothetical protein CEB3_c18010 [Peptococcaceae bacterium CEB3]